MSKKRIAIVANTSWNILNFRMGLLHALRDAGHEVFVLAPEDSHSKTLREKGFEPVLIKGLARKGTNPLKDLMLILEFFQIYRKLNIDIALQYTIKPNIYGSIAGKLAGIKTVATVTGLGYVFLSSGITSKIAMWLYRFAFIMANKVFFQNSDDHELFLEKKLVAAHKSAVIPGSGIDTKYYHPDFCGNTAKESQDFNFVMIGRLLRDKGVFEYVEAAKQIQAKYPQTRFVLLGDLDKDNPASVTEEQIKEWKEQGLIDVEGFIHDTRPYICKADAVVLPSYREGIPRVILEGLAMGKPCITTDAPGCRHTVDHMKTGLICKTADANSLSKAFETFILFSPSTRAEMGQNARNKALDTFDMEIITEKYLFLVNKL